MDQRLQKILSAGGVCSRRKAEEYLREGRVTVNGVPAALGDKADPETDTIALDGVPVGRTETRTLLMLYKPRGVVTTLADEKGRRTVADLVKDCGFGVFAEPVKAGGSVRLINVNGHAKDFPRKKIDKLGEFVKTYKAKGLAWARMLDGKVTSSYQKFLTDEENAAILERAGAKDGDLILIVGDVKDEVVFASLGALRIECAKQLGILDPNDFKFLWVTEFPMFEWSEEEGRYQAMHHPFTAPMLEDEDKMLTDKAGCRARAYDIVLNGTELGGGYIRINTPEMQTKAFEALGISDEDIQERFGHLVNAFQYGAPPHGGLAYGLDRLVMLMTGASSIRDVIAFPKVQNASDLMMNCPDVVDDKQLDDLSIAVTRMEETPAEDEV